MYILTAQSTQPLKLAAPHVHGHALPCHTRLVVLTGGGMSCSCGAPQRVPEDDHIRALLQLYA